MGYPPVSTGGPAATGAAEPGRYVDRSVVARDAVRRMMQVAGALRDRQDADVAGLGLTPATARALYQLDPDLPMPARDLAEQLRCDRSNITALVDKLEEAGLVRRQVDAADRRLKTLVVTDDGRRVRAEVDRVMSDSRLFDGLTDTELGVLRELVWKISDGGTPECRDQD